MSDKFAGNFHWKAKPSPRRDNGEASSGGTATFITAPNREPVPNNLSDIHEKHFVRKTAGRISFPEAAIHEQIMREAKELQILNILVNVRILKSIFEREVKYTFPYRHCDCMLGDKYPDLKKHMDQITQMEKQLEVILKVIEQFYIDKYANILHYFS